MIWRTDPVDCAPDGSISASVLFTFEFEDYIYALGLLNTPRMSESADAVQGDSDLLQTSWACCGEQQGIMVYNGKQRSQQIEIPAMSVWSLTVLPNGDIVCGTSDYKIYVFTQNPDRRAPDDIIVSFTILQRLQ